MDYLLITLAVAAIAAFTLLGHGALWVSIVNRVNAYAFPHAVLRWFNRICLLLCVALPWAVAGWYLWLIFPINDHRINYGRHEPLPVHVIGFAVTAYVLLCWIAAVWAIFVWIARRVSNDESSFFVRSNHTQQFDIATLRGQSLSGNRKAAIFARIPGNQIFQLHTQTKHITLPGLPPALDGFSIAHLSDLHFAGHITREYYEEVVRQTNLLDADLIAVTGDIIDRPHCVEWFASTLGELRAPCGVYFILGNHEGRRCDPADIRRALVDLGLIDLGGQHEFIVHNGKGVLLAGNELPWLEPPFLTSLLPLAPSNDDVLSILLSHSPDQFAWAQREGYKLMLAGHVHGGQIRLPIVGPILSPSRYGVRYASGTFFRRPTLMHVTRGISGLIPLRFNCPPEVAKLVLHAPTRIQA